MTGLPPDRETLARKVERGEAEPLYQHILDIVGHHPTTEELRQTIAGLPDEIINLFEE